MNVRSTSELLRILQAKGKKTFSINDITMLKGGDKKLAYRVVSHMLEKKLVAPLLKGYYVIFSPSEFESQQCNMNDVIDQVMSYKKIEYYVGLLSAAFYYGATHYRPMVFQVITQKEVLKSNKQFTLKDLELHCKKNFPTSCIQKINGQFGYINYSTVALTMYDLFKYENHSGGIDNVIITIMELLPQLTTIDLRNLLSLRLENAYLQRLGYLLEKVNATQFSNIIKDNLKLSSVYIKLSRQDDATGLKNKTWRIIDNIRWEEIDDTNWND